MTAPSATELPTAQPNVPANSRHPGPRAVPSVSSVLILPPGPIVDRHRRPQERLQAARRPPAYPNQARIIAPVAPSPLFRCPHAVHRCPSVDSGLGIGCRVYQIMMGLRFRMSWVTAWTRASARSGDWDGPRSAFQVHIWSSRAGKRPTWWTRLCS